MNDRNIISSTLHSVGWYFPLKSLDAYQDKGVLLTLFLLFSPLQKALIRLYYVILVFSDFILTAMESPSLSPEKKRY